MKNLLCLILFIAIFPSCKKKAYNCFCSTTILYPPKYGGGQNYFVSNNKPMEVKMKEKQAKAVCDREADNINQVHINYWTDNGKYPTDGVTFTTRCNLQ